MLKKLCFLLFIISCATIYSFTSHKQTGVEPWQENQLMKPADLAKILNNHKASKPIIFSIGPSGLIKSAIQIGSLNDKTNLEALNKWLSALPNTADVVIYCGCCKLEHCPNIRPAFKALNDMKFSNAKLLNLPDNLKVDWVDKGYPMEN